MSYGLSLASWYLGFTVVKTQAGKFKSLQAAIYLLSSVIDTTLKIRGLSVPPYGGGSVSSCCSRDLYDVPDNWNGREMVKSNLLLLEKHHTMW